MNHDPETLLTSGLCYIKEKSKQTRKLLVLKALQCLMVGEKTTHQLAQWEDETAVIKA